MYALFVIVTVAFSTVTPFRSSVSLTNTVNVLLSPLLRTTSSMLASKEPIILLLSLELNSARRAEDGAVPFLYESSETLPS